MKKNRSKGGKKGDRHLRNQSPANLPAGVTVPKRMEKAVELLEALAAEEKECSLSALARRVGISRYRTRRLLESLEQKEAGEMLLPKSVGKGQSRGKVEALYGSIVREVRPVMESLARKHKETVYMTILKGEEVLFVDVACVEAGGKGEPLVGRRFPFFNNAAGKVMRAIDSWDLLEKIGKSWRRGRSAFPDLADLRRELEVIREKGVAVDYGGMGEGVITVAVAVRDYAGKVVGALTLLGPQVRLLGSRLEEEIIPSLLVSGELLSMKFGYARP